jgi:Flp pilus assembly pilin Flp/ribosomal protein S11
MDTYTYSPQSEKGQSALEYGVLLVLLVVALIGTLAVFGVGTEGVFERIVEAITGDAAPPGPTPTPGETDVTVSVLDYDGTGIGNVPVTAYRGEQYAGFQVITDETGQAVFPRLPDGQYRFQADLQAHQFYSPTVSAPRQSQTEIKTGQRPFTVRVVDSFGQGLGEVNVSAFNEQKQYTGVSDATDARGETVLWLVDGSFRFRADYQGNSYWSETVSTPALSQATLEVDIAPFVVSVFTRQGAPAVDVPVHVYRPGGTYTGISGRTGQGGRVSLEIPGGTYRIRADYKGKDYWSGELSIPPAESARIEVGPYLFSLRVADNAGQGIADVQTYLFNTEGGYLGKQGRTNAQGVIEYEVREGSYQFRVDYGGTVYWSDVVSVPEQLSSRVNVGQQGVTVTVLGPKNQPLQGTYVLLYTFQGGSYYYTRWNLTSAEGQVAFELPPGRYRVLAYHFSPVMYKWSNVFKVPNTDSVTVRLR